jgi:hypothetical protein
MVALAVTMGLAFNAHALNGVQVTLTSPGIVKTGCEKVGSVQFGFDAGSDIIAGDWWFMDLPTNTFVCSAIDYILTGGGVMNAAGNVDTVNGAGGAANFSALPGGTALGITNGSTQPAPGATVGPFSTTALGPAAAAPTAGGADIVIQVTAAANSRRVFLQVWGLGLGNSGNLTTNDNLTVSADSSFNIKIADGSLQQGFLVLDSDNDGIYGEGTATAPNADTLRGITPHISNTLCVNASQMAGDLMFTSFDSRNDKFTFTGDSQIAHVISANPLSLTYCPKLGTTGEILIGGQGQCAFTYETAAGYCPVPPATFIGNRLFLTGTTTFGDPGDRYDMRIYSDTPGVYFQNGANLVGFTPAATTECAAAPGGVNVAVAGNWIAVNEAGSTGATYAGTSCAVTAATRVREIRLTAGFITGIQTFDQLWIAFPAWAYDTSVVTSGTEFDVRVSWRKHPCGEIFSGTATLGTFVTNCTVGAGATTLLVPFLPAWDGSQSGWWGGFLIVNGSTVAGTATITFTDADGDCATFTTPSIAANGGQWNAGLLSDLLTQVTDCTGNTGTFGDDNVNAVAVCAFGAGGGFFFVGNGVEGVGSNAYVLQAAGWN